MPCLPLGHLRSRTCSSRRLGCCCSGGRLYVPVAPRLSNSLILWDSSYPLHAVQVSERAASHVFAGPARYIGSDARSYSICSQGKRSSCFNAGWTRQHLVVVVRKGKQICHKVPWAHVPIRQRSKRQAEARRDIWRWQCFQSGYDGALRWTTVDRQHCPSIYCAIER